MWLLDFTGQWMHDSLLGQKYYRTDNWRNKTLQKSNGILSSEEPIPDEFGEFEQLVEKLVKIEIQLDGEKLVESSQIKQRLHAIRLK